MVQDVGSMASTSLGFRVWVNGPGCRVNGLGLSIQIAVPVKGFKIDESRSNLIGGQRKPSLTQTRLRDSGFGFDYSALAKEFWWRLTRSARALLSDATSARRS